MHDLRTRCDPYVNKLLTGEDFHFHCHSNLTRAVAPHGLTELDAHDVLNVFQVTGLNDDDKYFMKACPAQPGDYLEMFAEIDLLCALSTCPGGDLSVPMGPRGARSHRRAGRWASRSMRWIRRCCKAGHRPEFHRIRASTACIPKRSSGNNDSGRRARGARPEEPSNMPAERGQRPSGDSGISIAERISHQLRDDIMGGKLPPGTQLVEVDLAAAYGASRNTIREVLHQLGREGLATFVRHGRDRAPHGAQGPARDLRARRALECRPSAATCRCSPRCWTRC